MAHIVHHFKTSQVPGNPKRKTALLINPPVYDTQYWAEWSQPYGLLRVTRLLWGILVTGGESCLILWKRQGKNARLPSGALHQGSLSMYMLNAQYRSRSFQLFGNATIAQAFRHNMRNEFEEFVQSFRPEEPTASHPL